jgi:hypothetical protein
MAAVVSGRQTANQKEYGREGRESDGTRPLPRTRGVDPTGYYGTHARAREFIASKDTSLWKIHLSANDQLSKHMCRGTRDSDDDEGSRYSALAHPRPVNPLTEPSGGALRKQIASDRHPPTPAGLAGTKPQGRRRSSAWSEAANRSAIFLKNVRIRDSRCGSASSWPSGISCAVLSGR